MKAQVKNLRTGSDYTSLPIELRQQVALQLISATAGTEREDLKNLNALAATSKSQREALKGYGVVAEYHDALLIADNVSAAAAGWYRKEQQRILDTVSDLKWDGYSENLKFQDDRGNAVDLGTVLQDIGSNRDARPADEELAGSAYRTIDSDKPRLSEHLEIAGQHLNSLDKDFRAEAAEDIDNIYFELEEDRYEGHDGFSDWLGDLNRDAGRLEATLASYDNPGPARRGGPESATLPGDFRPLGREETRAELAWLSESRGNGGADTKWLDRLSRLSRQASNTLDSARARLLEAKATDVTWQKEIDRNVSRESLQQAPPSPRAAILNASRPDGRGL